MHLIPVVVALRAPLGIAARQDATPVSWSCDLATPGAEMGQGGTHEGTPGAGLGQSGAHMGTPDAEKG